MDAGSIAFVYPLRFWRFHIILLKAFTPGKNMIIKMGQITQKAISIALSIVNTLLTVTAWVHLVEDNLQKKQDKNPSFFDVFYFITVTSTSGLSTNIVENSLFTRLVVLYIMVIGAVFLRKL